jgi:hypothetical protein
MAESAPLTGMGIPTFQGSDVEVCIGKFHADTLGLLFVVSQWGKRSVRGEE